MKKITFSSFIAMLAMAVLISPLAVWSQAPAVGTDASNWQTYRNEELGFEFRYPESYTAKEENEGRNTIVFDSDQLTFGVFVGERETEEGIGLGINEYNRYSEEHNLHFSGNGKLFNQILSTFKFTNVDNPQTPDRPVSFRGDTPVSDTDIRPAPFRQPRDISNPDLNSDGIVGEADLMILLNRFGPCLQIAVDSTDTGTGAERSFRTPTCWGDLNGDGEVGVPDLLILLGAWTEENGETKEALENLPERCQAITDSDLQRRCLLRVSQEVTSRINKERAVRNVESRITALEPAKREEVRQNLDRIMTNYMRYMNNMILRMTATIERLVNLSERIESRIEKFEEDGWDVSESRELFEIALGQIGEARSGLAELSTYYKTIASSSSESNNFRARFAEIRQMVHDVRESIQSAHRALVQVVESLKAQQAEIN